METNLWFGTLSYRFVESIKIAINKRGDNRTMPEQQQKKRITSKS